MEEQISVMLLDRLITLQENLKVFLVLYKNADKNIRVTYRAKTIKIKALYDILLPVIELQIIPDWIKHANCHPDEIPAIVKKINKADYPQILRIKPRQLKKHKKDFAKYLWRCYGVEMTWEKGQPKFNIGKKYRFSSRGGWYIIEKRELEQNPTQGETFFQEKLDRYEKLKGLILSRDLRDNVRHLQDVEKAKKYAEEIEAIMKEDKGGPLML